MFYNVLNLIIWFKGEADLVPDIKYYKYNNYTSVWEDSNKSTVVFWYL